MSWTWSTSQRESSPSPSPAVWRSRATLPTCRRLRPCCAPNTDTTTWYAPLCVNCQTEWSIRAAQISRSSADLAQSQQHVCKLCRHSSGYVTSFYDSSHLSLFCCSHNPSPHLNLTVYQPLLLLLNKVSYLVSHWDLKVGNLPAVLRVFNCLCVSFICNGNRKGFKMDLCAHSW